VFQLRRYFQWGRTGLTHRMAQMQEGIIVIFHAALVGRADVVQNAITSIRSTGKFNEKEISAAISTRRSEDGASPLHIASYYGHTDVIRSLLNAGADLSFAPLTGEYADKRPYEIANEATKETFHVYMFEQIAMNNEGAIEKLIEGGLPVDSRDDSPAADSTLHWAASFGSVKVATVLLEHGCDPNITNETGQTALHLACKGKHADVIELLLSEGARVDMADAEGKLPIDVLPAEAKPGLKELLHNPPVPSLRLHAAFEKAQEEKAAKKQLLLQQKLLLNKQRSNSFQSHQEGSAAAAAAVAGMKFGDNDYNDDDDLDLDSSSQQGDGKEKDLLLIFWPPVKRQEHIKGSPPLVLRNNANLLISVASSDIDMIPLLTWSGLMDVMDSFGFQVQIKRSSTGAKIRLCIDRNICPIGNSYELKVGQDQIFLTAGDSAGLMYGVYTLIQLLKLHSESHDNGSVLTLKVPSISISDRPDVAQRAVLWSYRQQARMSSTRMLEQTELFARLRFNTLLLVIDPLDSHHSTTNSAVSNHPQHPDAKSSDVTSTKIYALDEKCRRYCIDLIPTVIIQSVHQRLPLDVLKNFSHGMISIVFAFDKHSVEAELAGASSGCKSNSGDSDAPSAVDISAAVAAACITACEFVIKDAHLAGCSTISIACSEWARQTADPLRIAINAGVNGVVRDFGIMYPSSLFTKPLLCVQNYVRSIANYSSKVEENCSSISVFPAFMDRDFLYPSLLIKFYSFMFAGFSWNRISLADMLGDPADLDFSVSIVKEVMYLIMFPAKVELPSATFQVVMDLIMGATYASELRGMDSSGGKASSVLSAAAAAAAPTTTNGQMNGDSKHLERISSDVSLSGLPDSASSPGPLGSKGDQAIKSDLAKTEKLLWSLLTSQDGMDSTAVPDKSEAGACLRVYRRILQTAAWKPDTLANKQITKSGLLSFIAGGVSTNFSGDIDDTAFDASRGLEGTPSIVLEVEEVFCIMNFLAAICKALVLAHKANEKKLITAAARKEDKGGCDSDTRPAVMSFAALFNTVPVGTKSDFANSILECLNSCAFLWKRRFEGSLLTSFKASSLELSKSSTAATTAATATTATGDGQAVTPIPLALGGKEMVLHTIKEANRRFLLQDAPLIPASAVFRLITQNIPLPKSVHDFIHRLFAR